MPSQKRANRSPESRASRKFGEVLFDTIGKALLDKGFRGVDSAGIVKELGAIPKEGRPVLATERIYNLGLNKSQERSNVFVFTLWNKANDSVTVLMSSPRADYQAPAMNSGEIYFKKEFRKGEPEKIARDVAAKASKEALAKHPQEYRMQVHVHGREDFDGSRFFDDGASNIASIVRRAMLHNMDVLVFTPHNSLDLKSFARLQKVCSFLGITAVLGLELTMPLVNGHVNGPHHLLMVGSKDAAMHIGNNILVLRESSLKMPSYWRALGGNTLLDDVYKILEPLRKIGQAALGAAHPVNYNSNALAIKAVGLISAADMNQISVQSALSLAKSLDFMEAWNRSISPAFMPLENTELYNHLTGLVHKFNLGDFQRANANMFNLAVAMNLDKHHGGQSVFGSDDHATPPLDERYLTGGDYLGAGYSFFRSGRRLSSAEIVEKIADRSLGLSSHIYTETDAGMLQVARARVEMPARMAAAFGKLKGRVLENYIRVLISDAFGFIGKGEFGMLGKMDK